MDTFLNSLSLQRNFNIIILELINLIRNYYYLTPIMAIMHINHKKYFTRQFYT